MERGVFVVWVGGVEFTVVVQREEVEEGDLDIIDIWEREGSVYSICVNVIDRGIDKGETRSEIPLSR